MMAQRCRLAQSLEVLRAQIDDLSPHRSKASEGTIGNGTHCNHGRDYNLDVNSVELGLDITHDPSSGVDVFALAERLRQARDPRIEHVIVNGWIFSSIVRPWEWQPYEDDDPDTKHMHVSVVSQRAQYDDIRPWDIARVEIEGICIGNEINADVYWSDLQNELQRVLLREAADEVTRLRKLNEALAAKIGAMELAGCFLHMQPNYPSEGEDIVSKINRVLGA